MALDKLFRILEREIVKVKTDRNSIEYIKKQMYDNHLFLRGDVQEYIHYPNKIAKEPNKVFVILFTKYLYDARKNNYDLDPAKYFTDEEIKAALEFKNEKPKNDIVLHNVKIVERKVCSTLVSLSDIPKLFSITGYNFDVVKNYKVITVKQGDAEINERVLDLSNAQVKKRLKQIEEENEINPITLNINPKCNSNSFYYNLEDKSLLLKENALLELVDGIIDMHALMRASDSHNLIELENFDKWNIKLNITFFNDKELSKHLAKIKLLKGGIN